MSPSPMHSHIDVLGIITLLAGLFVLTALLHWSWGTTRRKHGTKLKGPPNDSFIFGVSRQLVHSEDHGLLLEDWSARYGPVFQIPMPFGGRRTIVCDPRAVNHFYSMERSVYVKSKLNRAFISNLFGRGLVWAEGDDHKRQRKALTPAFSNAAIRRLTTVFAESSHKLKAHWENLIDGAGDGTIIDVEHWMNMVALDSIGIAGFSHDFHSLDGAPSAVAAAFESFSFGGMSLFSKLAFFLGGRIPLFAHLPFRRNRIIAAMHRALSAIGDDILRRAHEEWKANISHDAADKSIIGLLLKSEDECAGLHMKREEILAQNVLLFAGYDTTSVSLTWALIELARNPSKQAKLRQELTEFGPADPTWDQLVSGLPYLDAVVHEILRLHPPVSDTMREAIVDDVLPLSQPIASETGEVVESITIPKGSTVSVHIRSINRSVAFWGPTAKDFEPERFFSSDEPVRASELQGYRHLLTFIDGPRACLGRSFALAEFKAVLFVLVRNFTFEFPGPDGAATKIIRRRALIPRPAVDGQPGANVPLRVRRVE